MAFSSPSVPHFTLWQAVEHQDFAERFFRACEDEMIRGAGRAISATEVGFTLRSEQFAHKIVQALVGMYIHRQ